MSYIDGFVLAVPKARLEDYKTLARTASQVWREHGALEYLEAVADDVPVGELTSFPRAVQLKDDEVVVFAWVIYASRADRDATMAKVMADPRIEMEPAALPFDGKRMIWGGFVPFVHAR
ncbi:DUF1428 domain-containing protein [Prosthecomicrobium sp. N25]|uniref:DUF1428 domain-containing protein n=1 Tax=Prosthecomicrobium sp. N25 TaxID=3129254 RepID=UPI00307789AA